MKRLIFLSLFTIMVFISGCQNNNQAGYDLRKDKSAPNYMSNPLKGNDVTNQNPNFLDLNGTRNGAASSGSGNTGVDVNKAKQVIGGTNEFRTDSVWINGDRMWVNVYKKGMLTDQAKIDAEARLHKKLTKALPRYNIEVRVQEDRR